MQVYQACVLSTLLYGSETWTLYSRQEHRLNTFHLQRILGITWQDHVLEQAGMPSMYKLTKRRLHWLGHVSRMKDGLIPKDVLYGKLTTGTRPAGVSDSSQHPQTSTQTMYAATATESAAQGSGSSATADTATPPNTDQSMAHIAIVFHDRSLPRTFVNFYLNHKTTQTMLKTFVPYRKEIMAS